MVNYYVIKMFVPLFYTIKKREHPKLLFVPRFEALTLPLELNEQRAEASRKYVKTP